MHDFNFEGGHLLSKIGASWFVSYSYYLTIDKSHINWSLVKTASLRKSKYNQSKEFHKIWLEQISMMSDTNLAKNTIKLSPLQIKEIICRLQDYQNHLN